MRNLEHLKEVSNSIVLKLRKQKLDKEQTKHALENRLDYVYEGHFTNDETWETPKLIKEPSLSYCRYALHFISFSIYCFNPFWPHIKI